MVRYVPAILIVIFVLSLPLWAATIFQVQGRSMEPLLHHGDRVWVWLSAFDLRLPGTELRLVELRPPSAGDVVLLEHPDSRQLIIKRIIGTPLTPISLDDGSGRIGEYTFSWQNSSPLRLYSRVPPGYYMVLGDNQARSQDSRQFGFVPRDAIRGKVLGIRHNGR